MGFCGVPGIVCCFTRALLRNGIGHGDCLLNCYRIWMATYAWIVRKTCFPRTQKSCYVGLGSKRSTKLDCNGWGKKCRTSFTRWWKVMVINMVINSNTVWRSLILSLLDMLYFYVLSRVVKFQNFDRVEVIVLLNGCKPKLDSHFQLKLLEHQYHYEIKKRHNCKPFVDFRKRLLGLFIVVNVLVARWNKFHDLHIELWAWCNQN